MSYKVFAVIISAAMLCTMLAGCKDKAGDMNKNSLTIGTATTETASAATGEAAQGNGVNTNPAINGAKKILLRVFQKCRHCDTSEYSKLIHSLLIVLLDNGVVLFFPCVPAPRITGIRKCDGVHINVVVPKFVAAVSGTHFVKSLNKLIYRRKRSFFGTHKNSFRSKTKKQTSSGRVCVN